VLRAYLVDPRNTRHREQVKQLLANHYNVAIDRVKAHGQDKEMAGQLAAVLGAISTEVHPIISIRAREEVKAPQDEKDFPDQEVRDRQEFIQRQIGDWLCGLIGDDMLLFVQAPEDIAPMLEIVYRFVPDENRREICRLEWKTVMRTSPDDAQPKSKTRPPQGELLVGANSLRSAVEEAARQTVVEMAGTPPAPQQPGLPIRLPPIIQP
jgi:hypothetical protein